MCLGLHSENQEYTTGSWGRGGGKSGVSSEDRALSLEAAVDIWTEMFGMIGQGVGAASTSLKELTLPVSIHPSGIFFLCSFFLGGGG